MALEIESPAVRKDVKNSVMRVISDAAAIDASTVAGKGAKRRIRSCEFNAPLEASFVAFAKFIVTSQASTKPGTAPTIAAARL